MNFMSYVAKVSRGWDEPNAQDMGRMTSQPNAKGEMYILNDGIDMKAKIAAMARRLEELEMKKMQEVQAISQTPLQAMPCAICLSYEHLVEECPTIPTVREMFGDCNTYNSNWRNHPNFSWKPRAPQYQQPTQPSQPSQQASSLEQEIVNLSKVVGDFIEEQKSINFLLSQRIDSVENRMDRMQNDLSQKIDNLQYSISRFANLNKVQEKGNSPSQPHQNSKGIHEIEAKERDKKVDLPTSKLEHEVESETEKEKREEIKGKREGKSIEKDDYIDEEPQMIVIKEEMKKHMPPPFPQALYGKNIQTKSQQSETEESSLGIHGKRCPDKVSGHTIGERRNTVPLAQHNSVHPRRNSVRRHFASGIPCVDILHPDISQPDGRGGRFNFSGQTYPDPLIAFTRRASAADILDYSDFAQCRGVLLKLLDICHRLRSPDRGARHMSSWGIRMELIRIAMRTPCHPGEGSLHLAHADGPPCDISHPKFRPPTFHIRMGEEDVSTSLVRHIRIF
uniref:Retrotransposon gag domain-containing protein n=1 Tax=Vitis vinifera TaxID=29760 RepID=A5BS37_VITVI|nr:hypothetical protein VITISV_024824 [Vitis vinifera]